MFILVLELDLDHELYLDYLLSLQIFLPYFPLIQIQLIYLLDIPYGQTTTYGQLARCLAVQMGRDHISAQAVGGAVGHNEISIIIPCHRVVGSSGSLTGYAGGIDKKVKLLELERTDMRGFFIPAMGTAL